MWHEVGFGKWSGKGKTLPQIIVADPDWFFWALENGAFKGALAKQAETLAKRARAIRLPPSCSKTHCIQYVITHDGKFGGFNVIPADQGPHVGSSSEKRSATLSLEAPRKFAPYDKLGGKLMIKSFKHHWFNDKALTKARVETFFDDSANFAHP